MKTKSCSIKVKAGPDDDLAEGEFVAYASVFGNKDSYGDVVQPGAFTKTLAEWTIKGLPIPVLWGHNMADPDFNIGAVTTAEEDTRGLKVRAQLDLESPKAAQVYRLLKSGRVGQMSFAYDIVDGEYVQPIGEGSDREDGYFSLKELSIYEVSIVPVGANQETEVLAVKTAAASLHSKAGRVLSAKNETTIRDTISQLESAAESLKAVLPGDEPAEEEKDQDKTSGEEPPPEKAAQPSAGKATPSPSVSLATREYDIRIIEMEIK